MNCQARRQTSKQTNKQTNKQTKQQNENTRVFRFDLQILPQIKVRMKQSSIFKQCFNRRSIHLLILTPIFDPYEYHDLCNESCSSCRPAIRPSCVAKTLTLDITRELLHHFFFIPAMLIGTIHFNYFISFSLTLTLLRGHMVSAKLASFSQILFIWSQ